MNDISEIGQILLKILVDEGPQSIQDLASKIPKGQRPSKKRDELIEIVGRELYHLDDLVKYDVGLNHWTVTEKYQPPTVDAEPAETAPPTVDEPAEPAPVILDGDPADDHLFVGYLGGAPQDYPPIHPYANLFPIVPADELILMVKSIQKIGLLEPIVYWRGQLLDGRNRFIACRMAGVQVEEYHLPDDEDPFTYIVGRNIRRRQLTTLQKAIIAEKAATATRGRRKNDGGALSLDEAAEQVDVSRRNAAMVRQIKETNREVYEAMDQGYYTTISAAARAAGLVPPKSKPDPDPEPAPPAPQPIIVPFPTVDADDPEPVAPTQKKPAEPEDEFTVATRRFAEALAVMLRLGPITRDRVAKAVVVGLEPLGYTVVIDRYGDGHIPVRIR